MKFVKSNNKTIAWTTCCIYLWPNEFGQAINHCTENKWKVGSSIRSHGRVSFIYFMSPLKFYMIYDGMLKNKLQFCYKFMFSSFFILIFDKTNSLSYNLLFICLQRKISIISGNNRLLDTKEWEWRRNSECLEFSKSKVFDGCGYREKFSSWAFTKN